MKQYTEHIPFFFIMVSLGIILNLLLKKEKLTFRRVLEEFLGSVWISIIVAGCLDYYTDMSYFVISGLSSFAGFLHSKLIDYIGNDLLVATVKSLKSAINKRLNNGNKGVSE